MFKSEHSCQPGFAFGLIATDDQGMKWLRLLYRGGNSASGGAALADSSTNFLIKSTALPTNV